MNKRKLSVGYLRCSTEEQADSPAQQKAVIEAYAAKNGFEIVEWFEDFGKTGTTAYDRQEFQRLLQRVENNPNFQYVLCYDESRWSRFVKPLYGIYYKVHFDMHGVTVQPVNTTADPSSDMYPLTSAFEVMQASAFSKKLSELVVRGKKRNGKFSTGGPPCYGYRRVAVDQRSGKRRELAYSDHIVRNQEKVVWELGDEEEIAGVKFMFEERAAGKSFGQIARVLNEKRVPCHKYKFGIDNPHLWSKVMVSRVIRNDIYYGMRAFGKTTQSYFRAIEKGIPVDLNRPMPRVKNPREDWMLTADAVPAIVSKELWDKANSFGRKGVAKTGRVRGSRYPLSGKIVCSDCHNKFTGFSTVSKGKRYDAYTDSGRHNKGICKSLFLDREFVDGFCFGAIRETLNEPQFLDHVQGYLMSALMAHPQRRQEELASIAKELSQCELSLQRLAHAINNGTGDLSLLESKFAERQRDVEDLKKRKLVLEQEDVNRIDPDKVMRDVKEFIDNFERMMDSVSYDDKRRLVDICIEGGTVHRNQGIIELRVRRLPVISNELALLTRTSRDGRTAATSGKDESGESMTRIFKAEIPRQGVHRQDSSLKDLAGEEVRV